MNLQKMQVLRPCEFLPKHREFIEQYKQSIKILSAQSSDLVLGIKDVDSQYLATNNAHMLAIGVKDESEIIGYNDADLPCVETASYAAQYRDEDQRVIRETRKIAIIKVHKYSDGFKARIIYKSPFYHQESNAILGVAFHGNEINLSSLSSLVPSYPNLINKVALRKHQKSSKKIIINNVSLTEYEYEVCYLLSVQWNYSKIANFMNMRSVCKRDRTADTIKKVKDSICRKFGVSGHSSNLKNILIRLNIHLNPPFSILIAFSGCIEINT